MADRVTRCIITSQAWAKVMADSEARLKHPAQCVKLIKDAFNRIDLDSSGTISSFELKVVDEPFYD